VLQTLVPNESYRSNELDFGEDQGQSLNFSHYIDILRRRIFYFLLPFGLISILGLFFAATQKPKYLSEGKILVESQMIAPDLVRPITTATSSERIQLMQQRVMTRDNLLSIANKFGLFPGRFQVDSMRKSIQIKPVEVEGQLRQGMPTTAFTVGFEHENPELAMRVANEFITLIVDEDARSRTSRATETVKILTGEAKDIEDKLESVQMQIYEIARRPRDEVPETPDQEKSQLTALAALKAELLQKTSVYSEAHPAVTALRKRIAAMEKTLTQSAQAPAKARSTQADDLEAVKRQRDVLETRLADANGKLATARLSEKLDRDQQSERFQIIELPSMPLKPEKSGRLKIIGIAFALAIALAVGTTVATERFDGSIRNRHQLSGVVDSHLVVSIPYIVTRSDIIRARLRLISVIFAVAVILTAWSGLAAVIVFNLPVHMAWSYNALVGLHTSDD
jgi:uncharacterized protein involved in exopolysaccharide biosynthesis